MNDIIIVIIVIIVIIIIIRVKVLNTKTRQLESWWSYVVLINLLVL